MRDAADLLEIRVPGILLVEPAQGGFEPLPGPGLEFISS